MTKISFTSSLGLHVAVPSSNIEGDTVRQVLEKYFESNPAVRPYVLDDQGHVRKHVAIFLNKELIQDRTNLSDPVPELSSIYVAQALSGG